MEKLDEIRKILKFYVLSNELKNKIIDEQNNYSVADHLFGSMIIATAIDSEFKETDDLSKIYRMLFLYEFSLIYPNYDFTKLKLGKQFTKEISEAKDMNNENGKLVFKYKMLDFLLTKLIKEKENKISQSDLITEGSTIIASLCSKKPSECEEIFKFYYLNFRLKNKVRTGWDSRHWNIKSDRIETVSEHVIGSLSLAIVSQSEFKYSFDTAKELKMLVLHETGETLIGDITPFDGITPEKKKELEHKAMSDALGNLKEKVSLLALLFEFDAQETPESINARYCDKEDADLQSKVYLERGMHHSLDDQKNNVVFGSQRVQQMVKAGAKDAFDIWYEWDRTIYEGEKQFPEFMSILKIARSNNILQLDKVLRERIDLTSDEHSFLSKEITDTVKELYKDDNIESIFLTNYYNPKNSKGTIYVTVILKSNADCYPYERIMNKINSRIAKENKTGVDIKFYYDYQDKYSVVAMYQNEVVRVEQLAESTILFDKTGKISGIQEKMKKYGHLYEFYLVDYVPPVDKAISRELTKTDN